MSKKITHIDDKRIKQLKSLDLNNELDELYQHPTDIEAVLNLVHKQSEMITVLLDHIEQDRRRLSNCFTQIEQIEKDLFYTHGLEVGEYKLD